MTFFGSFFNFYSNRLVIGVESAKKYRKKGSLPGAMNHGFIARRPNPVRIRMVGSQTNLSV